MKLFTLSFILIIVCVVVNTSELDMFEISDGKLNRFLSSYENSFQKIDFSNRLNLKCSRDILEFLRKITTQSWAAKMADASGKLASGIARGNLNSFGSFDECLEISYVNSSKLLNIKGKYCLVSVPLFSLDSEMKRYFEKPGFKPRIGNINNGNTLEVIYRLGLCLPASCDAADFEFFLSSLVESQLGIKDLSVTANEVSCRTDNNIPFTTGDWVTIGLFSLAILITGLSSLYDVWFIFYSELDQKQKNQILASFSIYSNSIKLFKTGNSGKLSCLNGIRVLSTTWIMLGHRFYETAIAPLDNIIDLVNWANTYSSSLITSSTVSVDSFFLMSGLLISYSFFQKYEKGKGFNVFMFYFHRFLRLTPALAVAILFYATLLKHMGNGPVWYYTDVVVQSCVKNWWETLLYIQNLVHTDEICPPHAWYLAVDMQLYIISPLFIIPFMWKPRAGMIWTALCVIISIVIVIILGVLRNWNGGFINQSDPDFESDYYFKPYTRASPWLIGFLGGYIITKTKKNIKMHKVVLFIGWMCCLTILGAIILGGHTIDDIQHKNTTFEHISYLALSRPAWALALLWIILVCYYGYGGPVNWFLSLGVFQVTARLTYAIYLVHLTLQLSMLYSLKTSITFSTYYVAYALVGDIGLSLAIGYFYSMMFEAPILNLEKIFIGTGQNKKVEAIQNKIETTKDAP